MNILTLPCTSLGHLLAGRLLGGLATTVILAVLDLSAATPLQIAQQAYLKASNTGEYDNFGWSVAVSGDTVVVGASTEGSNFRGVQNSASISAEQTDNSARGSGAVYVFVRSGGNLIQQAYLKASNADAYDYFGWSVAVSGDTIVVGAPVESSNFNGVQNTSSITPQQTNNSVPLSGAAYVFVRTGTTWSQQAYLKASNPGSNDYFGLSVSVSGDTVVVGAPYEASNATGVNGNQNNNGAFAAGAAYVFVRSGANWSQQAYLKASNAGAGDGFGASVAISGDTVVAGAPGESSNAIGVNGNQGNNSAPGSGASYVFVRSGANWSQQAYLKASNTRAEDDFGTSVAVSGDTVVVGAPFEDSTAPDSGAAYVFVRSGTTWSPPVYLKASNPGLSDWFGRSVSVSVAVAGDTVVVGAPLEDSGVNGNQSDNSASRAGAAYVFARNGTSWTQEAYLKASNAREDDVFGLSVAVSGDLVVVGAPLENSAATGVNGNQNGNTATNSGAAYVALRLAPSFELDPITGEPKWPENLNDTHVFANLQSLTSQTQPLAPSFGVVPYDINVPFWSDGAIKTRWFIMPTNGLKIQYIPNANWVFPTGVIWVKHFDLETTTGDESTKRRLETRFIYVKSPTEVFGATYRWNWDGSPPTATLVGGVNSQPPGPLNRNGEMNDSIRVQDSNGNTTLTRWCYPSRYQCRVCHTAVGGQGLGFNTAQLNRDIDYHDGRGPTNQLAALCSAGYFTVPIPDLDQLRMDPLRRLAHATNNAYSLEWRVRSYLDANCKQCHQPGGEALTGWDARISVPIPRTRQFADRLLSRIVQRSTDNRCDYELPGQRVPAGGQMPPLATKLKDQKSIDLLTAWGAAPLAIISPAASAPRLAISPDGSSGYFLRGYGVPGSTYSLQSAPSVTGPWTTVGPFTVPASGLLEDHVLSVNPGSAFYRTVQP